MKTYLITYDLIFEPGSPFYSQLEIKIKSYQYWAKPLKNVWLIKTTTELPSVINYLRADLYAGDKILIMEVNNNWTSIGIDPEVVKWMQGGL